MEYETIFNRFLSRIKDVSLLSLEERYRNEILQDYLTGALGIPYVRKIFSEIEANNDYEELTYKLADEFRSDADSNDRLVLEVLVQAMTVEWLRPQIDNALNLAMVIGGKEEKVLQNNLKTNMQRLHDAEIRLQKYIRDHGYYQGSYES